MSGFDSKDAMGGFDSKAARAVASSPCNHVMRLGDAFIVALMVEHGVRDSVAVCGVAARTAKAEVRAETVRRTLTAL